MRWELLKSRLKRPWQTAMWWNYATSGSWYQYKSENSGSFSRCIVTLHCYRLHVRSLQIGLQKSTSVTESRKERGFCGSLAIDMQCTYDTSAHCIIDLPAWGWGPKTHSLSIVCWLVIRVDGSAWKGVGLVLLNRFSFWHPWSSLSLECELSVVVSNMCALAWKKSKGPVQWTWLWRWM